MLFGRTYAEKEELAEKLRTKGKRWLAWRPVRLYGDGRFAWLEVVIAKTSYYSSDYWYYYKNE